MDSPAESQIYIIDDHEESRNSLRDILVSDGYHVKTYADPQDFFASTPANVSGCLITDYKLKEMDGLQVVKQVKRHQYALPVIVVSAYATIAEVVAIMRAGAHSLLQKPCSDQEILTVLKEALESQQLVVNQQQQFQRLKQRFESLAEDEIHILECMISGQPTKAIAVSLDISTRTVDRRRTAIFEKLQAKSLAELAKMYIEWVQTIERNV